MTTSDGEAWSWPAEAIPPAERMSDWLRLALTRTRAIDPSQRNRVYKARVVAHRALAIAKGDMVYALSIVQLSEAEVGLLGEAAKADPKMARLAAVRVARGDIGFRKLAPLVAGGLTESSIDATTIEPWPLERRPTAEVRRDTRWDDLEPARWASGLSSTAFAALHRLPETYVRKCTMLMAAARRLAEGKPHRARRIVGMSHIRILDGDKAVRARTPEGRALIAHLDRKEAEDA